MSVIDNAVVFVSVHVVRNKEGVRLLHVWFPFPSMPAATSFISTSPTRRGWDPPTDEMPLCVTTAAAGRLADTGNRARKVKAVEIEGEKRRREQAVHEPDAPPRRRRVAEEAVHAEGDVGVREEEGFVGEGNMVREAPGAAAQSLAAMMMGTGARPYRRSMTTADGADSAGVRKGARYEPGNGLKRRVHFCHAGRCGAGGGPGALVEVSSLDEEPCAGMEGAWDYMGIEGRGAVRDNVLLGVRGEKRVTGGWRCKDD
ncbi:hypothetical protein C8R45DRAFT_921837 [Mycena sanguinolenta]|nr:hypothetical protein C8R45DRAFT_921837 [Mycena sanguinolenta]